MKLKRLLPLMLMTTVSTGLMLVQAQGQTQAFPAARTALVMGAWDYADPTFPELMGIEEDLDQMAAKLQELGFRVTVVKNPTLSQAKTAVDTFGAALKTQKGGGLFYFSGHGAEHEGKNYLIPVGTSIQSRNDLDDEALTANRVLGRMEESGSQVNLVFLDCCRNTMSKSGGGDGLAPMNARGSLIGYATASGKFAFSTNKGSPYTEALLKHLGTPGVSLTDMHTLVSAEVQQISAKLGTDQRPGQYAELSGIFQLVPATAALGGLTPVMPPANLNPPPAASQPAMTSQPSIPPPATAAALPEFYAMAKPPFSAQYAAKGSGGTDIPTFTIVSTKKNNITDDQEWFEANSVAPIKVDVGNPFMNRPTRMPGKAMPANLDNGNMLPLYGITGEEASFIIYGYNFSQANVLLLATPGFEQVTHLLDFTSYSAAPKVLKEDKDYVYQATRWAQVKDGVLYVAHGHRTYAKSSFNMNAYITAIDLASKDILWRSQPLMANAENFVIWDDAIVTGYGFTAEKDYLHVLNRHTGETTQKLLLKSGPDVIVRQGDRLLVRCYDTDYVLKAK